jgi:hypothetical protein
MQVPPGPQRGGPDRRGCGCGIEPQRRDDGDEQDNLDVPRPEQRILHESQRSCGDREDSGKAGPGHGIRDPCTQRAPNDLDDRPDRQHEAWNAKIEQQLNGIVVRPPHLPATAPPDVLDVGVARDEEGVVAVAAERAFGSYFKRTLPYRNTTGQRGILAQRLHDIAEEEKQDHAERNAHENHPVDRPDPHDPRPSQGRQEDGEGDDDDDRHLGGLRPRHHRQKQAEHQGKGVEQSAARLVPPEPAEAHHAEDGGKAKAALVAEHSAPSARELRLAHHAERRKDQGHRS